MYYLPPPIIEQIINLSSKHKIITIGELHGARENPEIVKEVLNAISKHYPICIGFEYPQKLIDNIDKSYNKLISVSELNILVKDGRFSIYHHNLLKSLIRQGFNIFGFDLNTSQQKDQPIHALDWRDSVMANNINVKLSSLLSKQKLTLVMGDMHFQTKTQDITHIDNQLIRYKPTGMQICVKSILALHLRYHSGKIYNTKLKSIPPIISINKQTSFRKTDDLIEIDIKKAHPINL